MNWASLLGSFGGGGGGGGYVTVSPQSKASGMQEDPTSYASPNRGGGFGGYFNQPNFGGTQQNANPINQPLGSTGGSILQYALIGGVIIIVFLIVRKFLL